MKGKVLRLNMRNYSADDWTFGEIIANEMIDSYGLGTTLGSFTISELGKFIQNSWSILAKQKRKKRKILSRLCDYSGCRKRNRTVKAFHSYEEGTVFMCVQHRAENEWITGYTEKHGASG
jgi:hypothetical protein